MVAVFDFDKTITKVNTIKFVLLSLALTAPWRLQSAIPHLVKLKLKTCSPEAAKHGAISSLLANRTIQGVNYSLRFYTKIVDKLLFSTTLDILNSHLANNTTVIIATASPSFAVSKVFKPAQNLYILGTQYGVSNNRYTGNLLAPVPYGLEKAIQLKTFLRDNSLGTVIDEAYTDSVSDYPILKMAQKQFMVDVIGNVSEVQIPVGVS